jgi:hypothetical protein
MQRNIEVQNENRHMEESMAEMEKDLVEIKMKYAEVGLNCICKWGLVINCDIQVNENHEALQRKLNDFRKALD